MFPTTLTLVAGAEGATPPQGITEVLNTLLFKLVDNPVNALMTANYIGILAWGVGLGLALHHASATTKAVFEDLSHGVSPIDRLRKNWRKPIPTCSAMFARKWYDGVLHSFKCSKHPC